MTIANKITIFRIALIPAFVFFAMTHFDIGPWLATIIFIIASFSDLADGYMARKRNEITSFGKFVDPLADKILVVAALISLVQLGKVEAWAVILIVSRDFIVTGLRILAISENVAIAADSLGKFKTVSQMVAITVLLLSKPLPMLPFFVDILFYTSVVLTCISGFNYIYKYRFLFK